MPHDALVRILAGTDPQSGLDYSYPVGEPAAELPPVTSGDMWRTRWANLPPWSGRGRGPLTQWMGRRNRGFEDLSQYLQTRQRMHEDQR